MALNSLSRPPMPILLKFQSGLMIVCCDAFLKKSQRPISETCTYFQLLHRKVIFECTQISHPATNTNMHVDVATSWSTNLHTFHNHLRFSLPCEIERRLLIGFLKTDACVSCGDSDLSLFCSCTFACDFHHWNVLISQLVKKFEPCYC